MTSWDAPGIDRVRARLLYFSVTVEVFASLLLCLGGAAACFKWMAAVRSASCRIDRRVLHRRAAVGLLRPGTVGIVGWLIICQLRRSVVGVFSFVGALVCPVFRGGRRRA